MGAGADLIIRIVTKGTQLAKSQLNSLGKEGAELGGSMSKLAKFGIAGVGVALIGVAKGISASLSAFKEFDSKLTQSLAIMETTEAQQQAMIQATRDVAMETTISANESAEAYFYLASAGLDAEQSISALPQVAKFAQAGMFDMSTATDLATDAQSALGLTVKDATQNLENLTRVTDVLVKANTLANATVQQFSEALTNKAGSALKVTNKDIEEGVAVLAVFADKGVKGAEAGEKLNQILRDVSRAVKKNEDAWRASGIVVTDETGNLLHISDVIANLTAGMDGLSDTQKAGLLDQLGLNRGVADGIKILAGSEEQIRAYDEALREASGTTAEIAENQMDTLQAQLDVLHNKWQILLTDIGSDFEPTARATVGFLDRIITKIIELREVTDNDVDAIRKYTLVWRDVQTQYGYTTFATKQLVRVLHDSEKSHDDERDAIEEYTWSLYKNSKAIDESAEAGQNLIDTQTMIDDLIGDTQYTVAELTSLFEENGIAMDENAEKAIDLAKAYEDELLDGIESVLDAMEALEDRQDRINKAETARNKALKKQTEATNEVAKAQENLNKVQNAEKAFIARRDFALKQLQKSKEESKKVTAEEELAILEQTKTVNELTDAQDGSREKELELQIAKARLTELTEASTSATDNERQAQNEYQRTLDELEKHYEDVERAQQQVTVAKERETEAIAKVREEQEKLNKLTEQSLKNTLEYAKLQDDLNQALEEFGKGTKGYNDALEKMAQLTGVKVTDMMKMYDALFAKASQVGLDVGTGVVGDGAGGGGGAGGTKFPASGGAFVPTSTDIGGGLLQRNLGGGQTLITVNTGTSLSTASDIQEAVAKALQEGARRGINVAF